MVRAHVRRAAWSPPYVAASSLCHRGQAVASVIRGRQQPLSSGQAAASVIRGRQPLLSRAGSSLCYQGQAAASVIRGKQPGVRHAAAGSRHPHRHQVDSCSVLLQSVPGMFLTGARQVLDRVLRYMCCRLETTKCAVA
eukprot:1159958-Pelagomonas_calceolata.AAC.17